jgi:hypothetical protein
MRQGAHRERGAVSERRAVLPDDDGLGSARRPSAAQYTTPQLEPDGHFEDWDGLPAGFDWKSLLVDLTDAEYSMDALRRQETAAAAKDTVFAAALRQGLADRGHEDIRRSAYKLPALLSMLEGDVHEARPAWMYIHLSRGIDLVGRDVVIEKSHLDNYSSAEEDHRELVEECLDSFFKHKFVDTWGNIAKELKLKEAEPLICLPLGAVLRNGVVRIVYDPSVHALGKELSVNALMEVEGRTCLATIQMAAAAMSRNSTFWRADLTSAFCQMPLSARSVRLCGFRWKRAGQSEAQFLGFRRLGFGFAMGPYLQQCLSTCIVRGLYRELGRRGLACPSPPPFDAPQCTHFPRPSPDAAKGDPEPECFGRHGESERGRHRVQEPRHALTNCLSFLDDYGGFSNSFLAGSFSFAVFLQMTFACGIVVSGKPGKTEPPKPAGDEEGTIYLGFVIICALLVIKLDEDRTRSLHDKFDAIETAGSITVKALDSLVGVLVFCSLVVSCARVAYQGLLAARRGLGPKVRKSDVLLLAPPMQASLGMLRELVKVANGKSVIQGARRPLMLWDIWSDACLLGYGWWSELGVHEEGRWPSGWAHRIGQAALAKYRDIWICELECLAVLFACRKLLPYCAGACVRLHCDNLPVVQALRKHSTRSARMHPVLLEIELLYETYENDAYSFGGVRRRARRDAH